MSQELSNPADAIAGFVSSMEYDDLPDEAVRLVERAFVDTVGVTVAGADGEGPTRAASTIARLSGDGGGATILGSGREAPVADAALVNGTAGHWHDYDDVIEAYHMHPSVPLVAAILACGEGRDVDGESAIAAFAAGFETIRYIADPINPEHYERGWHATATYGTFSATAAVGHLLDLEEREIAHALNIAGSMPAGLKRNFGSMTKSLHAGCAARNGVLAATLASEGYEATPDALVGEDGFYDLYRGDSPPALDDVPPLGERWALVEDGIDMKKYPCCYFTHASIEATLRLVREHDVDPEEVEAVTVEASRAAKSAVIHDRPGTPTEGKFSMPYVVANAIVHREVGLPTFTDERLGDEAVRSLLPRVSFEEDTSLPFSSHAGSVTVQLRDGRELQHTEEQPPGVSEDPLTDEELRSKFIECATTELDERAATTLYNRLNGLRDLDRVDDLIGAIVPKRPA